MEAEEEKEPFIPEAIPGLPSSGTGNKPTSSEGSPDDYYCWRKCKTRTKLYYCIWIAVTIVAVAVLFVGTVLLAAYLYIRTVGPSPAHDTAVIGGGVPVRLPYEFDPREVDRVHLNLSNITGTNGPTTVYYGKCDDIQTSRILLDDRSQVFPVINTLLKPQRVNYNSDFPIYALNGSSLSYHITISTNSFKQGCAYLVLFNTSKSYQMFFDGQRNDYKFYNKSGCIKVVKNSHSTTTHTLELNESTFIFGAIYSNVTFTANVTISGDIREYDTTSLTNKTVNTTLSDNVLPIDLCDSIWCNIGLYGEKKCILVKTSGNNTIIKYSDEKVDLSLIELERRHKITVHFAYTTTAVGAALLVLVIIVVICIVLKYKLSVKKLKLTPSSISSGSTTLNQSNIVSSHSEYAHEPGQGQGSLAPGTQYDSSGQIQLESGNENNEPEKPTPGGGWYSIAYTTAPLSNPDQGTRSDIPHDVSQSHSKEEIM